MLIAHSWEWGSHHYGSLWGTLKSAVSGLVFETVQKIPQKAIGLWFPVILGEPKRILSDWHVPFKDSQAILNPNPHFLTSIGWNHGFILGIYIYISPLLPPNPTRWWWNTIKSHIHPTKSILSAMFDCSPRLIVQIPRRKMSSGVDSSLFALDFAQPELSSLLQSSVHLELVPWRRSWSLKMVKFMSCQWWWKDSFYGWNLWFQWDLSDVWLENSLVWDWKIAGNRGFEWFFHGAYIGIDMGSKYQNTGRSSYVLGWNHIKDDVLYGKTLHFVGQIPVSMVGF